MSFLPRVKVRKNSAGSTFDRARLNFSEGSGITLTVTDSSANDEVQITITATSVSPGAATGPTNIGQAESDGVAGTYARSDHVHAFAAPGASYTTNVRRNTAEADGTATTPARSDHVHAYSAVNFDSDVQLSRLDQMAAPTASVSMNSHNITNVLDPVNPQDAATKNYVDAMSTGLDLKDECDIATTTVLPNSPTYANGSSGVGATLTAGSNVVLGAIDGVTPTAGMRILVKNQASSFQNGIYSVTNVGSGATPWVLTRVTDMDQVDEFTGAFTFVVAGGTVNANTGWVETTIMVTVGTTAVTFAQFSGAGTYTAGNGLQLTGTVFSVLAADASVTVTGSGVAVTFGAPTSSIDIGDAQTTGTAVSAAHSDHQHAFTAPGASYAQNVAAAEVDGTATTPARSDHVHAHGTGYRGGHTRTIVNKTGNYTALTTDDVITTDATSASFTITLYAASGNSGRVLTIKRTDSTVANTVTVDANASETIDGALTYILTNQYDSIDILCDGSNWQIV